MTWLVLGLVLFLGIHSVSIVAPRGRHAIAHRIGEGPWKGLYTLVALAGFGLIVAGYSAARQDPVLLWTPPTAMRHVAALLMLPVFVLLFSAYLPGRIQRAAKHPMLVATKLWALAHLLANGNLADVVLFGAFLAWAVADRISVKRRAAAGLLRPVHGASPGRANDAIALVGGLAVYAVFAFWLHGFLIGVRPFG
ncbi:MAG: NnrU family protein [Hydrogenophaga sp.]|uniref:NnrU family protein n=1 Tax=Hydrogenophaga crocea TaxID=2716225 RepID=A0A6G8IHQ1_9BURK|nr:MULTISPECIES: NnrU family protein [Hydrogenophaga]MBL0944253.1 NnrU family protein [Hydrogenophaga sp.]QIM52724.1 NnrU family protein [Hydrogenophaga crocea]